MMINYSMKSQKKDISAWKMMILFVTSVYAQDTYSMYLYYVVVVVLTMKNVILSLMVKSYAKYKWLSTFFVVALGITTLSFILRRISWMEEMKAICYVLILMDSLFIYTQKPKVFEKGMRMILGVIVISALFGIIEAVFSYNIFEQYFVADYIRGYYGTELYRIASIYMHPIVCGQILLIGFWLVFFFYDSWKRTICLIIIAFGIYYTKSRSIWGGLAFSIIIFVLVKTTEFFMRHKIQKRKLFYVPFAMACIYLLYRIGMMDTIINNIYERILAANGSTSVLARQSMSMHTYNYMIHDATLIQKIFGYGLDSSKSWIYRSGIFVKAYDAIDNSYLTILYEFGLIGLFTTMILFIRKVIKCFYKKNNTNKLYDASVMAIVSCVIPVCFYDFYGWLPVYIMFIYCVVSSNAPTYITES
ncbi:MAG: O-antigen ligase family protein [Lachnospiraceae bacterium]|nr:O-antigen ligase family protein [Lachnospiraceae bacterium]